MGPDALRTAGLGNALAELGYGVTDLGNLNMKPPAVNLPDKPHRNERLRNLSETAGWIEAIAESTYQAARHSDMTMVLGGDHSIAAGSIPALAKHAAEQARPFFVLWLDAHADMHRLDTTVSGNLHGTPVAYMLGCDGFDGYYPPLMQKVEPDHICMMGLRSVDTEERNLLNMLSVEAYDMRAIDLHRVEPPLTRFLERVAAANGHLHVSLDVDFLDPTIACAVGTTVPGGTTFREAHLIMELLHESGLVRSLDLVELNPALDEQGKTARLIVDLTASLMGRTILDRPTRHY